MIWYAPAVPGRLENQAELVCDPGLSLELSKGGGSEH
jgi:hypothetical protein